MERSSSLDNLQYAIFGSRKAYISTMVHVQNILWHWVITHQLRVWILYLHSVSSHATDTRKSAQNNQNLMNSPLWQLHDHIITMQCTQQPVQRRTGHSSLTCRQLQCLNWQNTETSEKYCLFGCKAVWTRINSDVPEIPTASTVYSPNRGIKLFRNVSPAVHSATTRKTHAIQTSNLEICLQASWMW
jgi:hypothetical protein